jgi:hypothetical protein
LVTQSRGDHAFGLAWLDEDGSIRTMVMPRSFRSASRPSRNLRQ